MAEGAKIADAGFQYLGTPYSVIDCQAFVEKCLSDCGISKNLPGSNAWYREVMKNGRVMTPEECVKEFGSVPKGAFLFILAQDGKEPDKYKGDGIGNASHIGLCTGTRGKGAIHSSSSKGCVCESDFKGKSIRGGWNRIGLWDKVNYGLSPEPSPEPETVTVYAENGLPVNMRTRPSKNAPLIDRVPCGESVELIDPGGEWSRVGWKGRKGYMMTKFLSTDGVPDRYCIIIHGLSFDEAEGLALDYPNTEISKERG